ncbi:MAG TPA: DUF262 domain-containing protein [Terriglobales bacterium]|nr:DUF262 domain-containing protein [Terriglobales bacterium]
MALDDEIGEKRKEIRTDGYPVSIGEWISLYQNNEIDIHPEFQRFFRWTAAQKTNLIESILLGIPIPPIFVSQRKDGVWDVVDGLQRLSTIYQFLGILKDEDGKLIDPLVLESTKYLPSLGGKRWEDLTFVTNSLSPESRLLIKRSKIEASIILRESDATAKYDLFQRLNTGGSQLSPQEVRNCILVMLNRDLYWWLRALANHKSFVSCTALSEHPVQEAYDIELVLRFVIFSRIALEDVAQVGDVGVFLTERMRKIASDATFSQAVYENSFKSTFDMLDRTVGSDAFKRYDVDKKKHAGGFLLSQYEVVAFGLGYNIDNPVTETNIPEIISSIWSTADYTKWSGAGMTATRRLPKLIPLGRKLFAK